MWKGVESKASFSKTKKSSIFNKTFFTETFGTNVGHLHIFVFVFAACDKLINLINFFDCTMKQGIIFLFLVHTKDGEPKDQIVKSAPSTAG